MEIIWTNAARLDNLENIDYLMSEWTLKVVLDYQEKVIETEDLISKNPQIVMFVSKLNLYTGCTPNIYDV